ncbi:MAG: hypothetical protein AAFY36_19290 [Bacteroidota bacterium]
MKLSRLFLAIGILFCCCGRSVSQSSDTLLYMGQVIESNAEGLVNSKSLLLLEKIHLPEESKVMERATFINTEGLVTTYPSIIISVSPDNSFTAESADGMVSGQGHFFGQPWSWTYFFAEFTSPNGVRIEDENFFSNTSVLTARKTIFLPGGEIHSIMEISARRIERFEYDTLSKAINK